MKKVIIIGPAHPLRGGLASFDERLALAFKSKGDLSTIFTFSLQYPEFLFPGTTQYTTEPPPKDIDIKIKINSISPFNWLKIGLELKKLRPDIIVIRYWLPFMGPCFGTILRIAKLNCHSKIVAIADNAIPHEKRFGDRLLTKYCFDAVDAFVTMSEKVYADLDYFTKKPKKQIIHPMYDNFGKPVPTSEAKKFLNIHQNDTIFLFFGFIRKYKGLDLLLEAISILKKSGFLLNNPIKFLIAGEFYESKDHYLTMIQDLDIMGFLLLHTDFIDDSKVKFYLSACDFVVQPYKTATQSGVTPLAYFFEKPTLVTNVGGLPSRVFHLKTGVVSEPNPISIAENLQLLFEKGEYFFKDNIKEEKKKYSWDVLTDTIKDLADG